jgi:hypothetical protein
MDFSHVPAIKKAIAYYLFELECAVKGFGRILKLLDEKGLDENTLTIFTTIHKFFPSTSIFRSF